MQGIKTLKFRRDLAQQILAGKKSATWRLFDDKNLSKGDELALMLWESKEKFADAVITSVREKKLGDIEEADYEGHEKFISKDEMLRTYREYYGSRVNWDTIVKIVHFRLIPTS